MKNRFVLFHDQARLPKKGAKIWFIFKPFLDFVWADSISSSKTFFEIDPYFDFRV